MTLRRLFATLLICGIVCGAGFLAYAWQWAIPPIEPPPATSFSAAEISHGAELAALGDCDTCHTAPGGRVFAGGLAFATPFGTIYSTNITPDPDTGIGRWPEVAFRRAMHEGVDRQGSHLYPVFPYDHFTYVSATDDAALYAFLMTRAPVRVDQPQNLMPFPMNIRLTLAGWKLLFFHPGSFQADATQSAIWNRGAYLVAGLGHCAACHSPRNFMGAEIRSKDFDGGVVDGWMAVDLNGTAGANVPWTAQALASYLKDGWQVHHGSAQGPMAPVPVNLATVPPEDVTAIADYIASLSPAAPAAPLPAMLTGPGQEPQSAGSQTVPRAIAQTEGAAIYTAACAACHESGRPLPYGGVNLALSTSVSGNSPLNLINIILAGLPATTAGPSGIMPGFSAVLSDAQIVALANYLHGALGHAKPWPDMSAAVASARARMVQ